ncbi:MAG TPA: glycosyltransferase [Candidatus Limnocylindrales bacterium]|nr:glycosyltransferase [Candidatus Limnocylindrales bacterium]
MPPKKDFKINLLSLVVPSFKQKKTIVKDINSMSKTLNQLDTKYEIIVVIDGDVDNTYQELKKIKNNKIKIISYPKNQGKGHAVRVGMLKAKGDIIGFLDAGMDIHPTGFKMLLNHMEWYDADIIVGSKLHPVSKVNYPFYRKVLSWGYRQVTKTLFGFKVRDTQVGLKFFKRKVVKDVLPRLLVKKYAFDIEILAVSYLLGYKKIYEAPIEINFKMNNIHKSDLIKVVSLMAWDTLAVFYRLKILNYYKNKRVSKRKSINKNKLQIASR